MIKALLLIFFPISTWERIVLARRQWGLILLTHLLPLLLLVSAAEAYGLVRWARPRGEMSRLTTFPLNTTVVFEVAQLVLSLLLVFVVANLVKALGETFHGRHTFTQAFTVAAYGMSPIFLMRALNALSAITPWATWGIGAVLAATVLYNGLPRVMLPDPPHAFGLYLVSTLLLIIVTGLACFLTVWYLDGRFARLDAFFARIAAHLPF